MPLVLHEGVSVAKAGQDDRALRRVASIMAERIISITFLYKIAHFL